MIEVTRSCSWTRCTSSASKRSVRHNGPSESSGLPSLAAANRRPSFPDCLPRASPGTWRPVDRKSLTQTGLQKHTLVLDELERLCGQIVYQTLARHGHQLFVVGHSFTTQELADSLSVLPQHVRLLHRLLSMLEEDKCLGLQADTWTVLSPAVLSPTQSCDPDTALARATRTVPVRSTRDCTSSTMHASSTGSAARDT